MNSLNPRTFANLQALKTEISEYMEVSNYRDFIIFGYPKNIAEVVDMEREISEFDLCLFFEEMNMEDRISEGGFDQTIALQYFEATNKLKSLKVSKQMHEEALYKEIRNVMENKM